MEQFSETCNPRAACGPRKFLCRPSHDLGISQYEKGGNFLLLRATDTYIHAISERKG